MKTIDYLEKLIISKDNMQLRATNAAKTMNKILEQL